MKDEQPIDQASSIELQAQQEWVGLLGRLQDGRQVDLRLARVREAIACGEFQIDARVIAERLIGRLLTS